MYAFDPPAHLSAAFAALTLVVVVADLWLVRRAAPAAAVSKWTATAAAVAALWLGAHAAVASSGLLEGSSMPPPVMPYMLIVFATAVGIALSPLGRRLAALPLAALVGLQAFRLPLEILLHELYSAGALPVQMTWSGYNYDVLTGIGAVALGLALRRRELPAWAIWAWNAVGSCLLLTVVTIAVLSTPTPLRQFHNEPAVLMVYHAPFNWIVNVHVWTALVGHLVIFRALLTRRSHAA